MLSHASFVCRRPGAARPAVAAAALRMLPRRRNDIVAIVATSHPPRFASSAQIPQWNGIPSGVSLDSLLPSIAAASSFSQLRPQQQPHHRRTQARHFAGRKDRYSAAFEVRPPTRKQRKTYHRRRRKLEYEKTKHSPPNSKAYHRRMEEKENTKRLIEIALEEEVLKKQLGTHFDKVNELQGKIEKTQKFQALLKEGKFTPEEVKAAARDAAKKAAAKSEAPHPPLPSWWQDRLTYDWGDALVDDLLGNSADLTSSPNPSPVYMGGEYGRLRRRVERMVRGRREEERLLLETGWTGGQESFTASSTGPSSGTMDGPLALDAGNEKTRLPGVHRTRNMLSDKLLSDLIRAHRDAHGKRTTPAGLASSLELLNELQLPLSEMGTWCFTSLLTCCKDPWEGRKVDELRRECGVRSNEYFWSALVDVYARSGDYQGAEGVLDEMLEESKAESDSPGDSFSQNDVAGGEGVSPIEVPPLPAYTSFFSSCASKLVSGPDVHPSVKDDAAKRAWERWKEMRVHSVPPDVMAYGALMRVFAAQGRAEKALDLLEEIMAQMMMPVSTDGVIKNSKAESKKSVNEFEEDGWYDDRDGNTVRVKPTTLLFTSALKAVAKSHEVATKFSGGKSKKNKRRESIAAIHARIARKVVILAEQAEVRQDDGFVAALMLCAAAAGDSSTARAIYLASKVRRLDHLRTCGGREHLRRLQGLIPEEESRMLEGSAEDDDATPALPAGGLSGGVSGNAIGMTQRELSTSSSNIPALRTIEEEFEEEHASYEHREYGTDTRILCALLLAHSKAMEVKGLGSMWAGRYNRGYLCENSVRYMEAYNRPQMENMAIPGLDPVQAGLSPGGWQREEFDDEDGNSKRLRKNQKFNIKQITDDGEGNRMDDMDSFFDGFDEDPDKLRRKELELLDAPWLAKKEEVGAEEKEDIIRDWLDNSLLGDKDSFTLDDDGDGVVRGSYRPREAATGTTRNGKRHSLRATDYGDHFGRDLDDDDDSELDHDDRNGSGDNNYSDDDNDLDEEEVEEQDDKIRFYTSPRNDTDAEMNNLKLANDFIPKEMALSPKRNHDDTEKDFDSDDYFDEEEWEKLMTDTQNGMEDSEGGDSEELFNIPGVATNDFAAFQAHLEGQLVAEGRPARDLDIKEARQLFNMMLTYNEDGSSEQIPEVEFDSSHAAVDEEQLMTGKSFTESTAEPHMARDKFVEKIDKFDALRQSLFQELVPERQKSPPNTATVNKTINADDYIEWAQSQQQQAKPLATGSEDLASSLNNVGEAESEFELPTPEMNPPLPRPHAMPPLNPEEKEPHIIELQQTLPGLPMNRIKKISDEFERTLGYPSILRLTLAVRENMPEAFSPQCLTRKNLANAKHLMSEAEKEGLVDAHLLNGMLRVYTNSGRIEPAFRFYNTEYKKHGMTPSKHSDRLLLEMFVSKKRIARAFKLKQAIESEGRTLDLLSYGTLVEHFGNRNQLGSALLLIKECIEVHGTPPGEKSLKNIRLLCRKNGFTDQVGLERMAGKDPMEWFRYGEKMKRMQNKKGKSSAVLYGMNRMLDI